MNQSIFFTKISKHTILGGCYGEIVVCFRRFDALIREIAPVVCLILNNPDPVLQRPSLVTPQKPLPSRTGEGG